MYIKLRFQLLQRESLPSREEHFGDLWKIAKLLTPFGLPVEGWYPSAATRKKSLATRAFDHHGPTPAALEMLGIQEKKDATTAFQFRRAAVWSGNEKGKGGVFSLVLSADPVNPICLLKLRVEEVEALDDASNMQRLMLGLLDIWPSASLGQVGPLTYYTSCKVFADRPGAGWMLYLDQAIPASAVPEAAEVIPVMQCDKHKGTLIVSVADKVFSVDDPEHVKTANAIKIRLADQDLLPPV